MPQPPRVGSGTPNKARTAIPICSTTRTEARCSRLGAAWGICRASPPSLLHLIEPRDDLLRLHPEPLGQRRVTPLSRGLGNVAIHEVFAAHAGKLRARGHVDLRCSALSDALETERRSDGHPQALNRGMFRCRPDMITPGWTALAV